MLDGLAITCYKIPMNHNEIQEKMAINVGFATINVKGWQFFWDDKDKVWDIETPKGWRTVSNAGELWNAIRENDNY